MIAVLKGDIIASRKMSSQEVWIKPLKGILSQWGETPKDWELVWGDSFQLQINNPKEVLRKAIAIKTMLKKAEVDARMAIGLGEISYQAEKVSESNGLAFIYSGEMFEELKKDKVNLAVKSPWSDFDTEINLYLKLGGFIMDHWTVSSAEIMQIAMDTPEITQDEIGKLLGIAQSSVSNRWQRARVDAILEIETMFRNKLKQYSSL
ncbi:MAG TPA: SatD family protein [Flavobacteriaceae bacterium]|nr:SatD family protein [Flavobacteriaceae bacterium]